jgi:hypothetical protein
LIGVSANWIGIERRAAFALSFDASLCIISFPFAGAKLSRFFELTKFYANFFEQNFHARLSEMIIQMRKKYIQ